MTILKKEIKHCLRGRQVSQYQLPNLHSFSMCTVQRPNLSVSTLSFSSWLFFIFFLADLKGNRFSEISFVIFTLWIISASSILKKMYNLKNPEKIKVKRELDFFFFWLAPTSDHLNIISWILIYINMTTTQLFIGILDLSMSVREWVYNRRVLPR